MSRYANNQNIAASVCDAVISREKTYRESILENVAICEATAPRFAREGELEETFMSMVKSIGDDSILSADYIQNFMQQQREALKNIAELNVENSRDVDVLVDSVRALKQMEVQNLDSENGQQTDDSDPGQRLKTIYDQKKSEMGDLSLQMKENAHYRNVCENMNEPVGSGGDDDIEMVHNAASQRAQLKCPITASYMEDPVKNKVCGHVYSRSGIESHIKQVSRNKRKCACPISGCGNNQLSMDQLEDDLLTLQRVKKELRRLERQKASQMSQADDVDLQDSDEE